MAKKKIMYQGDLKPDYEAALTLVPDSGPAGPVDLSTALEVRVIALLVQGTGNAQTTTLLFDRRVTDIQDTWETGRVFMEWQPPDTAQLGLISTEIEVMWDGEKPQTFRPPELVQIIEDFGGHDYVRMPEHPADIGDPGHPADVGGGGVLAP